MHQTVNENFKNYIIQNSRKATLKKAISILACFVVFITTYVLILPAITMENQTFCGFEEHTHKDSCYQAEPQSMLTCVQAEGIAHVHEELCYDVQNSLVCAWTETAPHTHNELCYEAAPTEEPVLHAHTEACNVPQKDQLICTSEESPGHAHSDACYALTQELQCDIVEAHAHGEDCFARSLICNASLEPHVHINACSGVGDPICEIEEDHEHEVSCYASVFVCGREAGDVHVHDDACYSAESQLNCPIPVGHLHENQCYRMETICPLEENEGHSHQDSCYSWIDVISCGREEGEPEPTEPAEPILICNEVIAEVHAHSDACFEEISAEAVPICSNADTEHIHTSLCYNVVCGLEEHTHDVACYSDPTADVETAEKWESTFADVELTGNWPEDVLAIARTQLGYTESTKNYEVRENGNLGGYTRYGAWYGIPYGDWCAMFVSFCLNYAEVEGMPLHAGVRPWIEELTELKLYHEANVYDPKPGDLIFYDWNHDNLSDHVGLVTEIIPATDVECAKLKAIEGNSSNRVQYVNYDLGDEEILGYSELPDNIEVYSCGLLRHQHNEYCCDDNGDFICQQIEHSHISSCEPRGNTFCGMEEHTHEDICYNEAGELICEIIEHIHTEVCSVEVPDIVDPIYYCNQDAHTHDEACYNEQDELICDIPEHVHMDACKIEIPIANEAAYLCGLIEHIHNEECYNKDKDLICQYIEHIHNDECTAQETYICGLHMHIHNENCYDAQGNMTCELNEHVHDDNCKAQNIYTCGMPEHTHSTVCYDKDGSLVCTMSEHLHTTACVGRELYYSDASIRVHVKIQGVENLPAKLTLKVRKVNQEQDPKSFGDMQVAVGEEMSSNSQYVSDATFYEMYLLSEGELYELPEHASVTVTMEFEEPLFTQEAIDSSVGTHAFMLTPEGGMQLPQEIIEEVVAEADAAIEPENESIIESVVSDIVSKLNTIFTPGYALEDISVTAINEEQGDSQTSYDVSGLSGENYGNASKGITSVTFQTNRLATFAVALANETMTGTFWERIDSVDDIVSGGTYMIVSAEGNYALSSGNSNYVSVTIEAVKGHERYYTISQDTNSNLRWNITKSDNNYIVKNNSKFLTANKDLTTSTKTTVSLTSGRYSSSEDKGPYWRIANLYNDGDGFKVGSPTYADTSNMLLFKLTDEKFTPLPDVDGIPSGSGNGSNRATDPQSYTDFDPLGNALKGENQTTVTDTKNTTDTSDDISVTGSYYSDAPTSDLERQFRVKPSVLSNSNASAEEITTAAINAFNEHTTNDGKVLTDKSVIYGDDSYDAFSSYAPNTFSVTLSTLGQAYQIQELKNVEIPVDVVFVLDVSGSMQDKVSNNKTRFELLVDAVNTSMYEIMEANPNNRVGIATYSSGAAVMLPLERYTATSNKYIETYSKNNKPNGIIVTKTLKDSQNNPPEEKGDNDFDSLGTFTQAGIAAGYNIFKAIGNDTTFTYTLGTGENAITESAPRQPVFVLVTDGEPTHCTNIYNDPLNGPYYGDGTSAVKKDNSYKNGLGIMGYYTVLSANYFKRMIGIQYENPALFYTIGIGIAETGKGTIATENAEYDGYKRAVLNPVSANLNDTKNVDYYDATTGMMKSLLEETFTSWDNKSNYITVNPINSYYGKGKWMQSINADVPVLKDHPYDNKFAYADDAFFDSGTGLANIFSTILDNSMKTNPYRFILFDQKSYVDFEDNIGEGMEIKGLTDGTADKGTLDPLAPKLLYADQFFKPSSISTTGNTTTITYSGTYVDSIIPGHKVDLSEITVSVKRNDNGLQTLSMYIPDTALPVYMPDNTGSFYYETLPVRLIYQVGLTAASEAQVLTLIKTGGELTFYTNRYEEGSVANSVLYPDVQNPYYFESSTDTSGNLVYNWQNMQHETPKFENATGTCGNIVTCITEYQDPTIMHTHLLGNNGKLVFAADVVEIPVEKQWVNTTTAGQKSVDINLYKVTESTNTQTGNVERTATLEDTITLNSENSWKGTFVGVVAPTEGMYYAIVESVPSGFAATYSGEIVQLNVGENGQLVNAAKVSFGEDGANTITITNGPNIELPETGSIGTHIYTAGGLLFIAAATILLCYKRRYQFRRSK